MQGKTIHELAAELERQQASKRDFVADTRTMSVATEVEEGGGSTTALMIDGAADDGNLGEFVVNDHCHGQIGDRLGIPKKFYDLLRADHPALLDTNVNTLWRERPERRMVRTLDGRARAFLSDRYRRLDNYDLAAHVLPIIGEMPDVRFLSCELTDRRMYIKFVLPRVQAEVKVGDVVQAGGIIRNSEVGSGAVAVDPFMYRLICDNGMVVPSYGQKKYHVGKRVEDTEAALALYRDETIAADDKAFWMKLTDVVRAVCTELTFQQIVADCKELTELRITGDPVQAIERLSTRLDLNDTEQGGVLRHLIEGGDLSAWGVLNAVTRTAQDTDDYDRATELEQLGGRLLSLEARELNAILAA